MYNSLIYGLFDRFTVFLVYGCAVDETFVQKNKKQII